jgi:hypothetical protein
MTIHIKAAAAASRVWTELQAAGSSGCRSIDLQHRTGLTWSQVQNAIGHINHEMQLTNQQPIVVVRRKITAGRGAPHAFYVLPDYYDEAQPYLRERLKDMRTRASTELTRISASQAKWPAQVQPFVAHSYQNLIRDIDFVLTQVG